MSTRWAFDRRSLHGRLLTCVEDAVSLHRSGEGERRRAPLAARTAPAAG